MDEQRPDPARTGTREADDPRARPDHRASDGPSDSTAESLLIEARDGRADPESPRLPPDDDLAIDQTMSHAGPATRRRRGLSGRLSPLNQRRWQNFKANKRGYWSLVIFLILFVISLFAEFIANDKPILVSYRGEWLVPALVDYGEEKFLPDDPFALATVDYKSEVIRDAIDEADGWVLWPPIRYGYREKNNQVPGSGPSKPAFLFNGPEDPCAELEGGRTNPACRINSFDNAAKLCSRLPGGIDDPLCVPETFDGRDELCMDYPEGADDPLCVPGNYNWLGTDGGARDVLARLIYGFRISVLFGLILTAASAVIGVAAGAIQGYFGGWTDLILQRVIEIWSSMPTLYLLIIVAAVLPQGFWILLGILLLFTWVQFVGVVRAEFLRARNFEYVNAARALGVGNRTIITRHLLPNAMVATLTLLPFILSGSITALTALDYLGFGLPPGSPSLGELLKQGRENLQAPWLGFTGFFALSIMLSLLVFVGEAVRDAFDPRKTFN